MSIALRTASHDMPSFQDLPVEIRSQIFSYLPVQQLLKLQFLSRQTYDTIDGLCKALPIAHPSLE